MLRIVRGGTLITAAETYQADILIDGEKIVQIGQNLPIPPDAEIIEAGGMLVMPGGIDVHAHLALPMAGTVSSDDHYTGHRAAAFGGTTTVIDFISQDSKSLRPNIDAQHALADPKAAVDYSFHMNITHFDQEVAAEIPTLVSEGITTIKVFTAYNRRLRLSDGEIFQAMRVAGSSGILTMLHAENGDVIDILIAEALAAGHTTPEWHARTRPAWGAVEAVLRSATLAEQAHAPLYIVHMNAAGEVDMLEYARNRGIAVMAETCPQYLFFTQDDLRRPDGAKWVCSPPMRTQADNARLWQGLQSGAIQTIATDHCPFFYNGNKTILDEGQPIAIPGKELGADDFTKIPNGLPGVGDRLPILWTYGVGAGRLTPSQFVALNATNPAKIFGLYPRKGSLIPGADADIVLWDPDVKIHYGVKVARHRTDYNLYEDWDLTGFPVKVFLRGNLIVDGDHWYGRPGSGQFLYRSPFAPVL
jgi:dihydropyrimidinase